MNKRRITTIGVASLAILAGGITLLCRTCAFADTQQGLPGKYSVSWIGNSYGKGLSNDRQDGKWVQDLIEGAVVSPGGMVYTTADWDEGGRSAGIYGGKMVDGKEIGNVWGCLATGEPVNETGRVGKEYSPNGCAVAVNDTMAFAVRDNNIWQYNLDGSRGHRFIAQHSEALFATNDRLLSVEVKGDVRLYELPSGQQLATFTVQHPGPCAIDKDGNLWIIEGLKRGNMAQRENDSWAPLTGVEAVLRQYTPSGKETGKTITGYAGWLPRAISFDPHGYLLVTDAGPKCQLFYYDITPNAPVLKDTFGQQGGITAAVAGIPQPDKFWGLISAGYDKDGNLYVVMEEQGAHIRKFDAKRNLLWELTGLGFVVCGDFDPSSDGQDYYTPNVHYSLDLTKTVPGSEWRLASYTLAIWKNPQDVRKTKWTNIALMRRVQGKQLLFTSTMGGGLTYYRFDGNIAVSVGDIKTDTWAYMPDANGDVWLCRDKVIKVPFAGWQADGTPSWGAEQIIADKPAELKHVERIEYDNARDIMYFTGDIPDGDWGIIGSKMLRISNWSKGNRTPDWVAPLPYSQNGEKPGRLRVKSFCIAADYLFTVGVETRGTVTVYDAKTGKLLGNLEPTYAIVGQTGWVDVPIGMRAVKRKNGEYLIAVEEDGFNKVLLYRWNPNAK